MTFGVLETSGFAEMSKNHDLAVDRKLSHTWKFNLYVRSFIFAIDKDLRSNENYVHDI